MAQELQVGATGKWIELEMKDENKRFIFPPIESLEGRIQAFINKYPTLNLVRIGNATVTSKDVSVTTDQNVFEGIPSKVDAVYHINLNGGHPAIQDGTARYSEELVNAIAVLVPAQAATAIPFGQPANQLTTFDVTASSDDIPNETTQISVATAEAPKPALDLTAQLRAQMAEQVQSKAQTIKELPVAEKSELEIVKKEPELTVPDEEQTVESAAVAKALESVPKKDPTTLARPSTTPSSTQQQLDEAIKKSQEARKKRTSLTLGTPPQNKLDKILDVALRIESMLQVDDEEAMTGEELSEWFHHHAQEVGEDKTFEMLAKRLKY